MAYKLKNDEEIDAAVKNFIASFPAKGGRNTGNQTWDGEILELRNYVIYQYIRQGLSRERIFEELKDRWGISRKSFDKYYKEALESLVVENKDIIDDARKKAIEKLQGIIEKCYEVNDFKNALKAQDQLNKINALYTDKKEVEVTGLRFDFGGE